MLHDLAIEVLQQSASYRRLEARDREKILRGLSKSDPRHVTDGQIMAKCREHARELMASVEVLRQAQKGEGV